MITRTTARDGQPGFAKPEDKALGLVWIDCPYPVMCVGLAKILEKEARVHLGRELPARESPSSIVLYADGVQGLSEGINRLREANPDAPIVVFGLHLDLPLAQAALREGTRGFIHAGMRPVQIVRALKVAKEGKIVAPRELLEYFLLIFDEKTADLNALSARQRGILGLVGEGLTNAQIAKRLFTAESMMKQHLRAAYKLLGRPQQPLWAAVTGYSEDQQQGQKGEQNGQIY